MSNTTIGHTAAESPGGAVAALASVLPVLLLGSKTCAALGCTTHHVSQQSCQCNAHCVLHNDCCEDFEAACPNVTLTNHTSSSGDANSTKSSHERGAKHPKSDSTAEAAGANTRPVHEKVHEKAHEPGSSTPDNKAERGKSDKGAAAAAADDEKPDADSTKAAHEAHEKQPKQPSHSAGGRSDKPQEAAKAAEKDKADKGKASRGRQGVPSSMVLAACALALFVPLGVSLILILRSRGMCGARFQPVSVTEQPVPPASLEDE